MSELKPIRVIVSCPSCERTFWVDANSLADGMASRIWCSYCGKKLAVRIKWEPKRTPAVRYVEVLTKEKEKEVFLL